MTSSQAEIFWSTLLFFFLSTRKPGGFVQPAFENPAQAEAGYEPKQGEGCCGQPCFLPCGTCQKRHAAFLREREINHLGDANTREKEQGLLRHSHLQVHPPLTQHLPGLAGRLSTQRSPGLWSMWSCRGRAGCQGQAPPHTSAKAAGCCAPPHSSQNYKKR